MLKPHLFVGLLLYYYSKITVLNIQKQNLVNLTP